MLARGDSSNAATRGMGTVNSATQPGVLDAAIESRAAEAPIYQASDRSHGNQNESSVSLDAPAHLARISRCQFGMSNSACQHEKLKPLSPGYDQPIEEVRTSNAPLSQNRDATSASRSSKMRSGYFQMLDFNIGLRWNADGNAVPFKTAIIDDELHGEVRIDEPVLLDLLESKAVLRLRDIHQYGVSALFGQTAPVTRLEHSIGAMLIVRRLGGSVEEQVVGLLHDISHTALSHVIDFSLGGTGEGESYHEVHKEHYLHSTNISELLAKHGLKLEKIAEESNYGLVERCSPRLCADRLDYALRDTVASGNLKRLTARKVLSSIVACPNPQHPDRVIAMTDVEAALALSRAYMRTDAMMWSEPTQAMLSSQVADSIWQMMQSGHLEESHLYTRADKEFWAEMMACAPVAIKDRLRDIEQAFSQAGEEKRQKHNKVDSEPSTDDLTADDPFHGLPSLIPLPPKTKIRIIDPDVLHGLSNDSSQSAGEASLLRPLSSITPAYKAEIQRYRVMRGQEDKSWTLSLDADRLADGVNLLNASKVTLQT